MEQTRLFIAVGISFGIFFLWSLYFPPAVPKAPLEDVKEQAQGQTATEGLAPPPPIDEPKPPVVESVSSLAARRITVESPLYRMVLSERGGAVVSMVLKAYREEQDFNAPLKELIDPDTVGGSVVTDLSGFGGQGLEQAAFRCDLEAESLVVRDSVATIKFSHQTPSGLVIEKSFTFDPHTYLVNVDVTLYNRGQSSYQGSLAMALRNRRDEPAAMMGFEGPSGLIDDELQQVKIKKIEEQNKLDGEVRWVAIEDRYFISSLIPKTPLNGSMALGHKNKIIKNQAVTATNTIAPGQRQSFGYYLFMGPKSLSLLKKYKLGIERAINFGWFDFLAKPCLWFMNFIYGFIPNYGVAIIILTLVTRALFWPLAKKSYQSMGAMRKLQPLMQEIREKYQGDKARINQETMTLYRTYKVNPLGGCLPMLIQLPVFFALYRMLYSAIELRHAHFLGWITDLSAPDRLFSFGFGIPFMEPPYGIPVLTLLMGGSMLLQQKMSPPPGDPTQARLMMFMPLIFTFIFINFSSGLVLYWFVGNIFSIAQQYYTQTKTA